VAGEDLHRLGMLADYTCRDLPNALPNALRRQDSQLTIGKLLHENRRPRGVAARFELAGDRDDVAVTDATDLDDLHEMSIYADIHRRGGHDGHDAGATTAVVRGTSARTLRTALVTTRTKKRRRVTENLPIAQLGAIRDVHLTEGHAEGPVPPGMGDRDQESVPLWA
jgi:hypothetical protein